MAVYTRRQQSSILLQLAPGKYVLKIRGTNSDKIWSTNEVELNITVLPPFFRSQIAYIVYTITTLIILLLLTRYYIKRAERRQKAHIQRLNGKRTLQQ